MTTREDIQSAHRWRQVVSRDASASFFYAVSSTKIYCRPSCPARLARRAGVSFFDSASEAELAGFRACKRCRPHDEKAQESPAQALARVRARIESSVKAGQNVRLADLAECAGVSPCHLLRRFKMATGLTPRAYALAYSQRIQESKEDDLGSVCAEIGIPAENPVASEEFIAEIPDNYAMEPFDFAEWIDWDLESIIPSHVCVDLKVSC